MFHKFINNVNFLVSKDTLCHSLALTRASEMRTGSFCVGAGGRGFFFSKVASCDHHHGRSNFMDRQSLPAIE